MDFSEALNLMKEGKKISREAWGQDITIKAQFPDDNSKMTKPYLYMEKKGEMFPLDLTCEAIFANDWLLV